MVPNWPTCPIRVAPRLKSAPKGEKRGSVAVFVAEWSCGTPGSGTPRSARSELIFRGELPAAASCQLLVTS